jgi:hypothetical protein
LEDFYGGVTFVAFPQGLNLGGVDESYFWLKTWFDSKRLHQSFFWFTGGEDQSYFDNSWVAGSNPASM